MRIVGPCYDARMEELTPIVVEDARPSVNHKLQIVCGACGDGASISVSHDCELGVSAPDEESRGRSIQKTRTFAAGQLYMWLELHRVDCPKRTS